MAGKNGLVLCVDDEPRILRSLQWLLQKDFEVEVAADGVAGLEMVRRHDFDVIISDQRMPGKMGSEFLCEAAKISPRSMRILLTGYSDLQATLRSVNEGEVFRFISKPWDINDLPRIVLEAVQHSRTQFAGPSDPEAIQAGHPENHADMILVLDDDAGVADMIRGQASSPDKVIHAKNIADAAAAFDFQDIGIVVSDTRVDNMNTTRMLKGLKQYDPAVVTVVFTGEADATDVIAMINEGQVFRILPKPVEQQTLAVTLKAAASKRVQLKELPESLMRHAVEALPTGEKQSLLDDIAAARLKKK
jgi:DNA-binding NtrC family response regulator